MAEISIGVAIIGSLVSLYKAYTEYKAVAVKAQAEQKAAPAKPEEATKGEQVAQVVETGIQKYGDDDDRADLSNFARNPERYREGLARVLSDIAAREPAFAGQLRTVAQQANIQTGGTQGTATVRDNARVYGTVAGVNTGTISGTYNTGDDKDDK